MAVAVAVAGHSVPGGMSKNGYHLVAVCSSAVPSEVIGAASDFCSDIPSGSGPHSPLESEITVVV